MKTSLHHLIRPFKAEIEEITETIKETIAPEKIVLFGSFAKGVMKHDRYLGKDGVIYDYLSDYDILIVTRNDETPEYELAHLVEEKLEHIKHPINLIILDIQVVNEALEFGQYFFTEIIQQGILLYDADIVKFAKPRLLSESEQREKSKEYYNTWFPRGTEFLIDTHNALNRGNYNKAAFELHQATESLLYTVLLVFTDYKPKTHNLLRLRKLAKHLSKDLFYVFAVEDNKNDKALLRLLNKGYIDARYKKDYSISKDELLELIQRIEQMQSIVEKLCQEKITA